MGNQADDEEGAPLVNPEPGDAPVQSGTESDATSEVIASTKTSRAWIRLLPLLVVLVVILVFVFQNPKDVKVSLFTISGTLPLSVALLGAVILGRSWRSRWDRCAFSNSVTGPSQEGATREGLRRLWIGLVETAWVARRHRSAT